LVFGDWLTIVRPMSWDVSWLYFGSMMGDDYDVGGTGVPAMAASGHPRGIGLESKDVN
jgi:hypothetical protein